MSDSSFSGSDLVILGILAILIVAVVGGFYLRAHRPTRDPAPSPEEAQQRRTEVLIALRALSGGRTSRAIRLSNLAKKLRWSRTETREILHTLDGKYVKVTKPGEALYESFTNPERAQLTVDGLEASERAIRFPGQGTEVFAPLDRAEVHVQKLVGDVVRGDQIKIVRGNQTTIVGPETGDVNVASGHGVIANQRNDIEAFLSAFRDALREDPLSEQEELFVRDNLRTAERQLQSDEANDRIVKAALRSLRDVAHGVAGSAAWDLVQDLGEKLNL